MNRSEDTVKKWQVVENVVAAIERVRGQAANWSVTQNAFVRQRSGRRRRQVDIFVECPSGQRTFRVGIDVKNERRPLDIECVEQLCAKGRKLELDRYVIVSTSGFAGEALEEARTHGVIATTLQELDLLRILRLEVVTVPQACLHGIEVIFDEGVDRPPSDQLHSAYVKEGDNELKLIELAGSYAAKVLGDTRDLADGEAVVAEVFDEDGNWKSFRIEDRYWPPPKAIRVYWSPRTLRIPGTRYCTEDGKEIFTAMLPWDGATKQLSVVAVPQEDGSSQVVITVGQLRPPRSNV